jgi:uncharacterized protein (DUF58 family)
LGASSLMVDPVTLMRIKSMELRAKIVVEGFWKGLHKSPFHGFSVEFTEYREYTRGDDTRHIDWKLYARSDRYYIKKYEDETNLRCHLLVDRSRSMGFGSTGYAKSRYAGTLAATLGQFLFTQGDAVGLATFDEVVDEWLPARNRPGHLRRLMHLLDREPEGRSTDLSGPLKRVAEMLTRRGMVVLISDLLAPIESLEEHLGFLRACGHEVVVFHVMDPAELTLDFEKASLFLDLESGRDMYIDPALARAGYREKLGEHLTAVAAICGRLGSEYHRLGTDEPLEIALYAFLTDRMRSGRVIRRNTGGGG